MKSIHLFFLFVILALVQLWVPAQMIFERETAIREGVAYKFKTKPIDPSDPFKGKYIYLNYQNNAVKTLDTDWVVNSPIYVTFSTDSLGFGKVEEVSKSKPEHADYLKTKVTMYNARTKEVGFSFPFKEFYMNENKAYEAELAHRKAHRDTLSSHVTHALIYFYKGTGVLDNVFIDDIPIVDYIEK